MTKQKIHFCLNEEQQQKLKSLALYHGYKHGDRGSHSRFLQAIAEGDLIVIPRKTFEKFSTNP